MGLFRKEFDESDDEEKTKNSLKPADFNLLLAGDNDDDFLFGIKYTK
jgi:U3 small nucleolar RNA-associated protein 25